MNELTHLDLFSGIGGFSFGLEAAGFRTIGFAELDPDASIVLDYYWPGVPKLGDVTRLCRRVYDCEVEDESGEAWCPRCDLEFGECACIGTDQFTDEVGFPDIITGGVPCQPASSLGQMRGTADERWLWPEAIRILRELRPRYAIFENPPSLLVLEGGRAWNGIVSGLVACGYDCWWDVFPAAAFGAGHLRERVILIVADAQGVGKRIPPNQTDTESASRGTRTILAGVSHRGTPAHAYGQGHAGNVVGSEGRQDARRPVATPDLRGRFSGRDWWHEARTGIPVLADGLPSRLVEAVSRCTGNSIIPQIPYLIGQAINQLET